MYNGFGERFLLFTRRLLGESEGNAVLNDERKELEGVVESAKQEWLAAQSYFDYAIDPELVDHAILSVQAAERKYMYWLKQAKTVYENSDFK